MKPSPETIKYLTQDEIKRLLSVIADKRDRAIFLLAYRHGLRASEIGMIRLENLDMKDGRIYITRLKGSRAGQHPLMADEMRYLKAHLKASGITRGYVFTSNRKTPISRRTLDYLMKAYCRKADIPEEKRHFHALKHSTAIHRLEVGQDIRIIQDWLGHRSITNTMIYTEFSNQIRDNYARAAFAKLPRF